MMPWMCARVRILWRLAGSGPEEGGPDEPELLVALVIIVPNGTLTWTETADGNESL